MGLLMNLNDKLLHRCTLATPAGLDEWGQTVPAAEVEDVACFVTGSVQRVVNADGRLMQVSYSALFLPTQAGILIGTLVTNVVDKNGDSILAKGRVIHVLPGDHYDAGRQIIQTYLGLSA